MIIQTDVSPFSLTLNQFRLQKEYCDLHISVDSETFSCHRLIMISASAYFRMLLDGSFHESSTDAVILEEVDKCSFSAIVDFIYTGQVELNNENVLSLLISSDYLRIVELDNICIGYIREFVSELNTEELFIFAERVNKSALLEVLVPYLAANFDQVVRWRKSEDISFDTLKLIVNSRKIKRANQDVLLNFLIMWLRFDRENRKPMLPELFKAVGFDKVSVQFTQFLAECLVNCEDLQIKLPNTCMEHTGRMKTEIENAPSEVKAIGSNKRKFEADDRRVQRFVKLFKYQSLQVLEKDDHFPKDFRHKLENERKPVVAATPPDQVAAASGSSFCGRRIPIRRRDALSGRVHDAIRIRIENQGLQAQENGEIRLSPRRPVGSGSTRVIIPRVEANHRNQYNRGDDDAELEMNFQREMNRLFDVC